MTDEENKNAGDSRSESRIPAPPGRHPSNPGSSDEGAQDADAARAPGRPADEATTKRAGTLPPEVVGVLPPGENPPWLQPLWTAITVLVDKESAIRATVAADVSSVLRSQDRVPELNT